jgi:hypothetical protein
MAETLLEPAVWTHYTLTYYARASVMEIKFEDASPDKNDTAVLPDGISIVDATAPITVTTTTTGMVRSRRTTTPR